MKGIFAIAMAASLSFVPLSGSQHLCEGFVEENDLWIGVDSVEASGITEEQFNAVLDRVEELYTPIIEARGNTLEVIRKWENGTVNAYATQSGLTWQIHMFGGLARRAEVTPLGFAAVACHEIGHHMGGAPVYSSFRWASVEGQADYFAMLKCMRLFMDGLTAEQETLFGMNDIDVNSRATSMCNDTQRSQGETEMCYQSAMAGKSLANLLAALGGNQEPHFETPDTNEVSTTQERHPKAQCRLDTYFQGALCDLDYTVDDTSQSSQTAGMCNRADGYTEGVRPKCWYKPL